MKQLILKFWQVEVYMHGLGAFHIFQIAIHPSLIILFIYDIYVNYAIVDIVYVNNLILC